MDAANNNSSGKVIAIFDDYGNASQYRRISARIPDFLEKYSPEEGYRVETQMVDLLSMQPGRLSLVREAVSIGKNPSDLGLSISDDLNVMVCTCSLINSEGKVISNRTASKAISVYKDVEILETAAFQRLLASLGYGGEVFDEDETQDIETQGRRVADEQTPEQATVKQDTTEPVKPMSKTPSPQPASSSEAETKEEASSQTDIPPALKRQVENLAKNLGVDVPKMSTQDDAKGALKELNKLQKERRDKK